MPWDIDHLQHSIGKVGVVSAFRAAFLLSTFDGRKTCDVCRFPAVKCCFEPLAILRRAEHPYIVLRDGYEFIHGASQ